ncbi:ABC transporter permease [Candidatus Bathyarchaeota archaeon A05DMB-2]|nr:ABC transporter permease [Candidatus Bathyarchaeota archaeon A05DMB-2]
MSSIGFPMKDLLRRRLQTCLVVVTLTLSVASTLFLLLFSWRVEVGIASTGETLTAGLSAVFAQFVLFVGFLIFAVGAVLTSFIVFLMMRQRTRDFGLIKAAGCPNGRVFGYFLAELLIITVVGCILGVVFGFTVDFAATSVLSFQAYQQPPNLLFASVVFAVFFILAVTFGIKPMLDAARASPVKLLSPVQYFGLGTGGKFKPLSRTGITVRLASRSLFRRVSANVRIIVLLSIVFILLTVSVAGSIIANDTTKTWVENAVGQNVILIAHKDMVAQYKLLTSQAFIQDGSVYFDYTGENFAIPAGIFEQLNAMHDVSGVDARLILMEPVQEMSGYYIDQETQSTHSVGDNRSGISLVVGVNPDEVLTTPFTKGRFLNSSDVQEAVIGDTLAQAMYSADLKAKPPIRLSDPFLQDIIVRGKFLDIVGVCVDPINSGTATYVPLKTLQNATGIPTVNVVLVKLDASADCAAALAQLTQMVQNVNPDFSVFDLNEVLQKNVAFLGSLWTEIMLLPLFTLGSAALCLVGYMILGMDEQRQEFGILRAIGAKPSTVVAVAAVQSVVVLLSSFAIGLSFGVITTLMILMAHPVVTSVTIAKIAVLLLAALAVMLILSLYPAVKTAKASILKVIA